MDRAKFYASLRARNSGVFGTSLSQGQVSGMEAILDEAEKRGTLRAHLAYMLATAYHETARTMQPIAEYGKGRGRKYGVPAGPYSKVYYGRGFVQLTWLENYQKAGKKLGVDLAQYPERAMELRIATAIMFDGMAEGWFTQRKLSDYEALPHYDYRGARKIINGTDKAAMIAGYAEAFEAALKAGDYTRQTPTPLERAAPAPKPVPAPQKPPTHQPAPAKPDGFWTSLINAISNYLRSRK